MYTSYVLSPKTKKHLLKKFPPLYSKQIGHHVTVNFGVTPDHALPGIANLKVIGYKNNVEGIEALVVSVNGSIKRPDGKIFHITWSLDPTKFKPQDSNVLLVHEDYTLVMPIIITTTPTISD
jgi:hypothetical protein